MAQYKDKPFLRKLSLQLKDLRKQKGVSQDIFFFDTNIHIARIETGKVNPSVSTIKRICDYFEITLTDFFEAVESM